MTIGPFSSIGPNAVVGSETRIDAKVIIGAGVHVGSGCHIASRVVLQSGPGRSVSRLVIGNNNQLRECVVIQGGNTRGSQTRIGDDNLIMAFCRIGPGCVIGNKTMLANTVDLPSDVEIQDGAIIGGMTLLAAGIRIGRCVMVGFSSQVNESVPPYMIADGNPCRVRGVNVVGLRRAGVAPGVRTGLKRAFRILYCDSFDVLLDDVPVVGTAFAEAARLIRAEVAESGERDALLAFLIHGIAPADGGDLPLI